MWSLRCHHKVDSLSQDILFSSKINVKNETDKIHKNCAFYKKLRKGELIKIKC